MPSGFFCANLCTRLSNLPLDLCYRVRSFTIRKHPGGDSHETAMVGSSVHGRNGCLWRVQFVELIIFKFGRQRHGQDGCGD